MRTSLRDATDLTPKNIIVPDERLALYLSDMLPGAAAKKMDTGIADEINKEDDLGFTKIMLRKCGAEERGG